MQIDIDVLTTWGATTKKIKRGEIIFYEGDESRFYYQIHEGEIKMYNVNNDGKEYTQGVFHAGESFAEPPLFINEPYPATATAMIDSVLIKLNKDSFMKILDEYPFLQKKFLKTFARRIYSKSTTARDIINNPPEHRLLSFLKSLKIHEADQNKKILIRYTRQEIANLTGLRVETVIRSLKKMEEQKLVEIINHKLYY